MKKSLNVTIGRALRSLAAASAAEVACSSHCRRAFAAEVGRFGRARALPLAHLGQLDRRRRARESEAEERVVERKRAAAAERRRAREQEDALREREDSQRQREGDLRPEVAPAERRAPQRREDRGRFASPPSVGGRSSPSLQNDGFPSSFAAVLADADPSPAGASREPSQEEAAKTLVVRTTRPEGGTALASDKALLESVQKHFSRFGMLVDVTAPGGEGVMRLVFRSSASLRKAVRAHSQPRAVDGVGTVLEVTAHFGQRHVHPRAPPPFSEGSPVRFSGQTDLAKGRAIAEGVFAAFGDSPKRETPRQDTQRADADSITAPGDRPRSDAVHRASAEPSDPLLDKWRPKLDHNSLRKLSDLEACIASEVLRALDQQGPSLKNHSAYVMKMCRELAEPPLLRKWRPKLDRQAVAKLQALGGYKATQVLQALDREEPSPRNPSSFVQGWRAKSQGTAPDSRAGEGR